MHESDKTSKKILREGARLRATELTAAATKFLHVHNNLKSEIPSSFIFFCTKWYIFSKKSNRNHFEEKNALIYFFQF